MNKKLEHKINSLPIRPGVYLYKNKAGDIIYVGKAVVLRKRVKQYFTGRVRDAKTLSLVNEIADLDFIELDSELDALFLESELVKRYMPAYNILLRDDKSQIYIKFSNDTYPVVGFTRLPVDDGAQYFGPYFNAQPIKQALRYLRRVYPYLVTSYNQAKKSLDASIGLSPKLETELDRKKYLNDLEQIKRYIRGERKKLIQEISAAMQEAASKQEFEKASHYRNQFINLKSLSERVRLRDQSNDLVAQDEVLGRLKDMFNLSIYPVRIEGYDISHMSGTNVVASMVVFTNGISDRSSYRKFKIKIDKNDDFYNMQETLKRRFSQKNIESWGVPQLVLIDGGKGQLSSALKIRDDYKLLVPMIGLAKQNEEIIIKNNSGIILSNLMTENVRVVDDGIYTTLTFEENDSIVKLFRRIRDEAHRFAVSYHSLLKTKSQRASQLDEVRGIGDSTRNKLLKRYKTLSGIKRASFDDLAAVIGRAKAKIVYETFKSEGDN